MRRLAVAGVAAGLACRGGVAAVAATAATLLAFSFSLAFFDFRRTGSGSGSGSGASTFLKRSSDVILPVHRSSVTSGELTSPAHSCPRKQLNARCVQKFISVRHARTAEVSSHVVVSRARDRMPVIIFLVVPLILFDAVKPSAKRWLVSNISFSQHVAWYLCMPHTLHCALQCRTSATGKPQMKHRLSSTSRALCPPVTNDPDTALAFSPLRVPFCLPIWCARH
mmetsp:Transcript_14826/g.46182  ORF Transcript_14826/g.46182 Transcript_14826/m.46182 type:complete len:224 (+) Transcript_14826:1158-1829(+)